MRHAALECCSRFTIDGVARTLGQAAGVYACKTGWVRLHTNFAHHRDGVLRLLVCPKARRPSGLRSSSAGELGRHSVRAGRDRCGMVVAALRSFDEWDAHPQATAIAAAVGVDRAHR